MKLTISKPDKKPDWYKLFQTNRYFNFSPLILLAILTGLTAYQTRNMKPIPEVPPQTPPSVEVTVDLNTIVGTSFHSTGMSHVDRTLQSGDPAAVANVKNLLRDGLSFQNTFIMAWGAPDPWPDPTTPGPSNWTYLDNQMNNMIALGGTPIISLMNAPWWMKGALQADGSTKLIPDVKGDFQQHTYSKGFTDYRGFSYPAGYTSPDPYASRVLDNQMDNWIHLVRRVAERYMAPPYNVRYFQVWNEMKGYFHPLDGSPKGNTYDFENSSGDATGYNARHGYTYMYNRVYQELRSVAVEIGIDPDTIMVGGPYPVVQTWTAASAGGFATTEALLQNKPYGTYDQRSLDIIKYWLQNKTGAGFITIDAKNRNKELTPLTDPFTANNKFADINLWIRSLDNTAYPGAQTLPIFYAEWYSNPYETYDRNYNNAVKADGIIKFLKTGGSLELTWGGVENTAKWQINPSMYTALTTPDGGQPLPWYSLYKAFRDYFGPGTNLLGTTQSSDDISVLASPAKTMLVNKTSADLDVHLNTVRYTLHPYEVRVIDTPPAPLPGGAPSLTLLTFLLLPQH